MSKRWFNNFCAVCFVVLMCAVMLGINGCAGEGVRLDLEVESTTCGNKTVTFSTDYQVEDLKITRDIDGGGDDNGCGGGYTIELGKGTTKDTETSFMIVMFRMTQQMLLQQMLGIGTLPPDDN